jgi:serine/threonine protein kinase
MQIANALVDAHARGWIHRDLKPDNVFVCEGDAVKLFDFGLAADAEDPRARRLTDHGLAVGTLRYMAPEQLRGRETDERTDVYALGVVLYEMLTGEHPWPSTNPLDFLRRVESEPARSLLEPMAVAIPLSLAQLVMRMIEADPERRPPTARAVLSALLTLRHY